MTPDRPIEDCRTFHDGTVSEPRLLHPEGVAIDAQGQVWCGGELGQIYCLSPDGSSLTERASTGGFTLGIAFDQQGRLYTCDLRHRAIFRFTPGTNDLQVFARFPEDRSAGPPNWPVVDTRRNVLYVSESTGPDHPGPGIWRFGLDTGAGDLWYEGPLSFANGMALAPDGNGLYIAETFAHRIVYLPINPDGSPGDLEAVADLGNMLPDGIALDRNGTLYIACYEPSCIIRLVPGEAPSTWLTDPTAHMLCHPTNCAFRGSELFIANLGRWHLAVIDTDTTGLALPFQ